MPVGTDPTTVEEVFAGEEALSAGAADVAGDASEEVGACASFDAGAACVSDVLDEEEACVLFEAEEVSPEEAGAGAGGGGLSSARTSPGCTALMTRTSTVRPVNNKK